MELCVYKTFKYKVINLEFLSKDLPLNNSAIMVKRNVLNWQSIKKIDTFEIFNSWNTFFPIFSWHSIFSRTEHSGINNNKLFLFCFKDIKIFVIFFTALKKKIFFLKYFYHWFNNVPSQSTLTHILPMLHFCTPWKRQKTEGFLTFSAGTEM